MNVMQKTGDELRGALSALVCQLPMSRQPWILPYSLGFVFPFIVHPSSFIAWIPDPIHPSSFIVHPSSFIVRSGG